MSEQSEREWKSYLLSKGVFANALRFAHLEKPEEVDRTSMVYKQEHKYAPVHLYTTPSCGIYMSNRSSHHIRVQNADKQRYSHWE